MKRIELAANGTRIRVMPFSGAKHPGEKDDL